MEFFGIFWNFFWNFFGIFWTFFPKTLCRRLAGGMRCALAMRRAMAGGDLMANVRTCSRSCRPHGTRPSAWPGIPSRSSYSSGPCPGEGAEGGNRGLDVRPVIQLPHGTRPWHRKGSGPGDAPPMPHDAPHSLPFHPPPSHSHCPITHCPVDVGTAGPVCRCPGSPCRPACLGCLAGLKLSAAQDGRCSSGANRGQTAALQRLDKSPHRMRSLGLWSWMARSRTTSPPLPLKHASLPAPHREACITTGASP